MRPPFIASILCLAATLLQIGVAEAATAGQPPTPANIAPPACRNLHQHCVFWASQGECTRNRAFMRPNCVQACGGCAVEPQAAAAPQPVVVAPTSSAAPPLENVAAESEPSAAPQNDGANSVGAESSGAEVAAVRSASFLHTVSVGNKIPAVESKCPRGVQVQEVQTRAVPTGAQYRKTAQQQGCAIPNQPNQCNRNPCFHARFRSADASCNHLNDSLKGAAYMPLVRLLSPNFEDGVNLMVGTQSKSRPSPRMLTKFLMSSPKSLPTRLSAMCVAFGQSFIHDIIRNTLVNTCKCNTRGSHCANIPLAPGDRRRDTCITFTRSIPMCGSGRNGVARVAMNENTAYMDASHVYGSDATTANMLRAGPFLKSMQIRGQAFPPVQGENMMSGDDRIDLFNGMTAVQTIILRYHNSVVARLQRQNPRWNADRLYQEARKIVGAVLQAITFNQFLPSLLGGKFALVGDYTGFKETVDPQVSHEFAGGGGRLHGMVEEVYPLVNEKFQTVGRYRLVDAVASTRKLLMAGTDMILRGMITTSARRVGRLGTSVTELLFGGETDMLAVNVQRGRDYGVKPYIAYRELCGLGGFTFEDWKEVPDVNVRKRVSELYQRPQDVDLYVGLLLETPQDGSILGSTMSCIFAEQMKRTRDGDRLFYKNIDVFTDAQRDSIDRMTLGRMMCEVGDSITRIQRNVFLVDNGSQAVPCNQLPSIDFSLWRDQ